tara:strand:+ start:30 stop:305 length:276 start_codon:yes stop_codon:yes gene_type:complete
MKQHLPDIIQKECFSCFSVLNEAEIAVIMMGDEAYRESLDLENDDAPCWVMDSGETHGFVGWNTQCVPTIDYIAWKLERLDLVRRGEINEL